MERTVSVQPTSPKRTAKRRLAALLFVVVSAMFGLAWTAGTAQAVNVVCKGSPIPAGFVIIGQTTNFLCSNQLDNAWIIDSPNPNGTTICKVSPFPAGYVITAQSTSFSCSNSLDNAWFVRTPTNPDVICKVSPFPAGYVINGQVTNFSCSNALDNAWLISRA